PLALRKDARPGDGEAIGVGAKRTHERHVLLVSMVVIVGDVSGVAVLDLARRVREGVPDRRTLAVLVPRAFDLVRRGGRAPEKTIGELPSVLVFHCSAPPFLFTKLHQEGLGARVATWGHLQLLHAPRSEHSRSSASGRSSLGRDEGCRIPAGR